MAEVLYFFQTLFVFLIAALVAFYIPGRILIQAHKHTSSLAIWIESVVIGMMLWGIQAFVFGFLHARFFTYLYLFICICVYVYKKCWQEFLKELPKKIDLFAIGVIFLGVLPQTLTFAPAGFIDASGLHFPIHDAGDHIWHASIIQELTRRFPPDEPGMYGILLKNYHFWFNLTTADLVRVFHVPLLGTQMIGMYLLLTVLFAGILYLLGTTLYKGKVFARWLLFFLFFSTDAGVIFLFFLRHTISFATEELIYTIPLFTESPAFSLATVMAMFGMYYYITHRKSLTLLSGSILAGIFGILIESKIYIGLPFMIGLWTLSFWEALHKKFSTLFIAIGAACIAAATFFPFSNGSSGLFFLPLDRARDFTIQKPFGLSFLDLRWVIYQEHHNYIRIVEYGLLFVGVYLFVQFGLRLLGFFPLKKTRQILGKELLTFLYTTLLSSCILGFFFYQKVGGANIWEFFLAALIVLVFLSALNLTILLEKRSKVVTYIIISAVVLISIPHWLFNSITFIHDEYQSFNGISTAEVQAYNFIRTSTPANSNILLMEDYNTPSSLTSILTNRNVLLSGTGVSQVMTPTIQKRIQDVQTVKSSYSLISMQHALNDMHTNYIVLYGKSPLFFPLSQLKYSVVFHNSRVSVIQVRK